MSNTAAPPPTAPPPTAEALVFTAPGTLRIIVSQQNTAMKDLADQVARQSIALKELQAKIDEQTLSAEVAHLKTDLEDQAGKIYSIQHGMFAHFQGVMEALSDKVYKMECSWCNTYLYASKCLKPKWCKSAFNPRCDCKNRAVKVNTKMELDEVAEGLCPALIHWVSGAAGQDGRTGAGEHEDARAPIKFI